MLALSGLGMLIAHFFAYLPWSLDVAFVALPFMWVGDFLRKSNLLEHKKMIWIYIGCLIVWVILGLNFVQIEMAIRKYPGNYLCLISAVAGSLVFIGISRIVESKIPVFSKFLGWCGNNSMIILGIHCLETRFLDWNTYIFSKIPFSQNWIVAFVIKIFIILIITWFVVQVKSVIQYMNTVEIEENWR